MNPIFIVVDGSGPSKGSVRGRVGVVVYHNDVKLHAIRLAGGETNNQSEYMAIRAGLRWLEKHSDQYEEAVVLSDSMLAVNGVNGTFTIRNEALKKLRDEIVELVSSLVVSGKKVSITWVPRARTTEADALTRIIALPEGEGGEEIAQ